MYVQKVLLARMLSFSASGHNSYCSQFWKLLRHPFLFRFGSWLLATWQRFRCTVSPTCLRSKRLLHTVLSPLLGSSHLGHTQPQLPKASNRNGLVDLRWEWNILRKLQNCIERNHGQSLLNHVKPIEIYLQVHCGHNTQSHNHTHTHLHMV